ncbi:SET domain protein [Mycena pura]|uniref:SET domain protein n=1 Tax=Mycena pura TaxID=153505 RepID=A0AAD7E3U2_9AGAR|nr:SET domain protein [Mycena pura]
MSPPNWPSNVHYISACSYHSSVSARTRTLLAQGSQTAAASLSNKPCRVLIRRISESGHPAAGQFGLFAAKKIPATRHIVDYVGEIHCDDRCESDYDLSLFRNNEVSVGIDASDMGNEARFVNDYRGISDKPNAVFVDFKALSGELRMRVDSVCEIKKGEEILVSYGKAWWRARKLEVDPEL